MEGLLHELVTESEILESLVSTKVPRGSDYALQWTLNRVVKKKVEHVSQTLEAAITRLLALLGADKARLKTADGGEPLNTPLATATVDMLQSLQRKVEYALKVARHSGVAVAFNAKNRRSLFDRIAETTSGVSAVDSPVKTREKKVARTGENFCWLFQPKFQDGVHKLAPLHPISYPEQWRSLAANYVCKGTKYNECVEYVRFAKEWHKTDGLLTCLSPYSQEMEAIERVYADAEDPWGYEIRAAVRATMLRISEPTPFKKLKRVSFAHHGVHNDSEEPQQKPAVLVATASALTEFVCKILNAPPATAGHLPMVAMDVEFCQKGAYRGSVCLIQLSTSDTDYIIDPLSIPKETVHQLNQITANPGILKVMHGIDHDVIWLQNDFGIYFVNVFDTFHAAKALRIPGGFSLYNLILQYCQIALDKSLQLSDWRVRPLSSAQIEYAREDTRYLLHVAQSMRNQILSMTTEPYQWQGIEPTSTTPSHLGRKTMLGVIHAAQSVAARIVNWSPPNFEVKLDRLHQSVSGNNSPITNGLRLCSEVIFAWRDLRARDINETPTALCTDIVLYKALVKAMFAPQQLKEALPGLDADSIRTMQSLLVETLEKIRNPRDVYIGMDLSRKRSRPADVPAQSAPSIQESVVVDKPVKRRKLLATEVDKIKSERADDGALTQVGDLETHSLLNEEDIDVIIKGYYQAGSHRMACFEKKGNQTWKSMMDLGDQPAWLCVLDSAILAAVACAQTN